MLSVFGDKNIEMINMIMNFPFRQTTIYLSVLNDFFEWSMLIGIKHCI